VRRPLAAAHSKDNAVAGDRCKCLFVLFVDEVILMRPGSPLDLGVVRAKFPASGFPEIIRAKYKLRILWDLRHGSRRFGEIRKGLSLGTADAKEVAPRVLSRELKCLVELGLLHRKPYEVVPPRVEYRLTALGRSFLPVISKILEWATRHPSRGRVGKRPSLVRPASLVASPANLESLTASAAPYAGRGN